MRGRQKLVWFVVVTVVIVRLALVIWAGNSAETPLTGGSDTLNYQTLGENIAHHRGLSYAGFPTALRAPMYPVFLAMLQLIMGRYYRLLARLIQFLVGIVIAIVCGKTSEQIKGFGLIAFAAALALPTQLFFQAEILTETFATMVVTAYLYAILKSKTSLAIGAIIGLGMLERFNLAALALVYVVYECLLKRPQAAKNIAQAALVAFLIVSPWFVRNILVFDRAVLYSTHAGMNLLSGIVVPDGRTTGDDWERLASRAGWTNRDIETNSVSRQDFPAEPQLDRRAMSAAMTELGRRHLTELMFLAVQKVGFFWLSTDQASPPLLMPVAKRLARFAGVLVYWILLGVGMRGWWKLKQRNQSAALFFAIYLITVTVLHIPFVMSTRIRTPFLDPAVAILAGCAFTFTVAPRGRSVAGIA
jgi:hypothetical protein